MGHGFATTEIKGVTIKVLIIREKAAIQDRLTAFGIALVLHAGIIFLPLGSQKNAPHQSLRIVELFASSAAHAIEPILDTSPIKKDIPRFISDVPKLLPTPSVEPVSSTTAFLPVEKEPSELKQQPLPRLSPVSSFSRLAQPVPKLVPLQTSKPVPDTAPETSPPVPENKAAPVENPLPVAENIRMSTEAVQIPLEAFPVAELIQPTEAMSNALFLPAGDAPAQPKIENPAPFTEKPSPAGAAVDETSTGWAEVPWEALPLEIPRVTAKRDPFPKSIPEIKEPVVGNSAPIETKTAPAHKEISAPLLPQAKVQQPLNGRRPVSAREMVPVPSIPAATGQTTEATHESAATKAQKIEKSAEKTPELPMLEETAPPQTVPAIRTVPISEQVQAIEAAPALGAVPSERPAVLSEDTTTSVGVLLSHLSEQIAARKIYPEAAKRRNVEGWVKINVRIGQDGRLMSSKIVGRSGSAVLDRAASDLVVSLFPINLPVAYQMEVVVTIEYRLSR